MLLATKTLSIMLSHKWRNTLSDGSMCLETHEGACRFEMPFNVWCDGCGELIGKGVRFNAEKKQTGTYLSTRIWSFTMHHHCGCHIVVRTDPKSCEYILEAGAKRKVCTEAVKGYVMARTAPGATACHSCACNYHTISTVSVSPSLYFHG
jgi:hypothetical protein